MYTYRHLWSTLTNRPRSQFCTLTHPIGYVLKSIRWIFKFCERPEIRRNSILSYLHSIPMCKCIQIADCIDEFYIYNAYGRPLNSSDILPARQSTSSSVGNVGRIINGWEIMMHCTHQETQIRFNFASGPCRCAEKYMDGVNSPSTSQSVDRGNQPEIASHAESLSQPNLRFSYRMVLLRAEWPVGDR